MKHVWTTPLDEKRWYCFHCSNGFKTATSREPEVCPFCEREQ